MDVKKATASRAKRTRDPVRTKENILRMAMTEFCQNGFNGARVERIAAKSKSNMRMIYHYFGSKEDLYLAVLETAYTELRQREGELDLTHADPVEGISKLIVFTFDFFAENRDILVLINNENLLKGRYLKKLSTVRAMTVPMMQAIKDLLSKGEKQKKFRRTDPIQFYVSLVALSQLHLLNRYTLSIIFERDLSEADWLKERRKHIEDVLMGYLKS